jgi:predicted glycosyltransferase
LRYPVESSTKKRDHGDGGTGTGDLPTSPAKVETGNGEFGYSGSGKGIRILLYSHDTLGLGHIQRTLKITRALRARFPELSILIVTGSPHVHRYILPAEVDYVKLPAVRKTGREHYESRCSDVPFARTLRLRSRIIIETIKEYGPHLFLVDHSPGGMQGEIVPSLEWLKANRRDAVTVLGMRDILDDPVDVISLWRKQGTYEILRDLYDKVFVYGSPLVFDTLSSYEFPGDLKSKSRYVGYITDPGVSYDTSQRSGRPVADGRKIVTATFGGGDGWGHEQIDSLLESIRRSKSGIPFDSMILTGPFVADAHWNRFKSAARDLPVKIIKFVRNTGPFLMRSDLVLSSAGYNTITDVLSYARRALVIPRIMYRKEQYLRARRLRDLGLVDYIHPDEASPGHLQGRISGLLSSEHEPLAEARRRNLLPLDGAVRLSEHLGGIFGRAKVIRGAGR